jgi:hypothetical protein
VNPSSQYVLSAMADEIVDDDEKMVNCQKELYELNELKIEQRQCDRTCSDQTFLEV